MNNFIDAHGELVGPLEVAAGLDGYRFFERPELLIAYKANLWDEHIFPGLVTLFGFDFASDLAQTSGEAADIHHFLTSLVAYMAARQEDLTEA